MAVWEKRDIQRITEMSWTAGIAQDKYYWVEHSFNYSENINCDDEMHGIKLATKVTSDTSNWLNDCQLVSVWDNWVIALPLDWTWRKVKLFKWDETNWFTILNNNIWPTPSTTAVDSVKTAPWTIFQDFFWYWVWATTTWQETTTNVTGLVRINFAWGWYDTFIPKNHAGITDEDIMNPWDATEPMFWNITSILNYNNTRLIVGTDAWEVFCYYPELDVSAERNQYQDRYDSSVARWETWWLKIMQYEAGCAVIALTCDFNFLKVWVRNEWWETKVYYYQGNNNLRSTYVYDLVDLSDQKVLRVYPINGMDYYTATKDGTDWYIDLYKLYGKTPYLLINERAGLYDLDVNNKTPMFVWPTSIEAAYQSWSWYVADVFWVWKWNIVNSRTDKYDRGYMKWKINNITYTKASRGNIPRWLCIHKNILYVSYKNRICVMRTYDTWLDGYQERGILISRELEWPHWGSVTKMLENLRLHYELNPKTTHNWKIEVYVSPNNLWKYIIPEWTGLPEDLNDYSDDDYDGWYKVMEIDQWNINSRVEEQWRMNEYNGFNFDWQTITYAIVITRGSETHATPIVREITMLYTPKGKANNTFNLHN